jgi:hydroxyacylglutathione hydrolase
MERKEKIAKMIVKQIVVGPLETNCYLLTDEKTKEIAIIDPGDEAEKISNAIKDNNLKPKFILLTHAHPDHVGALSALKNELKIPFLKTKEGDAIKIGDIAIKVIETPGHTPESVCFIADKFIFSGDTLFKGGIGRTDLEGGDFNQIQKSLNRLMEFPDDFEVWPGHGEETTIGEEKKNNPFLTF